ncbi:DNA polymerase I [candidate division TA06 bacterium]|uniref:DNA polymerase I n=1 Tax=candidate division TA06 bacterium TaxID=2250710 RepID=A0A523UTR4_UNCT6|nr:MAG: DNA polymerase I [candidate division TA06 bacterium]
MATKLFLIDGSELVHRSYFAFIRNPLFNSRGENTSAVFGYTNSLLKILEEYEPTHVVVCFDTSAPTFRHKIFAEYKATREKMAPELRNQLPMIHELTSALGISIVEMDGFEADDIMGTLAKEAAAKGHSVYLVSSDKDFLQLVGQRIKVISPGRMGAESVTYDIDKVREKFGVRPERVVDVLALAGDKIDNVPGIDGIGVKGAAKLIHAFGSVEELVERSPEIEKKSLREKIEEGCEQALLSKELVTIKVDTPVDLDMDTFSLKKKDTSKLRDLLRRLEFFSLMKKLQVQVEFSVEYVLVGSSEGLPELDPKGGSVGLYVLSSSKDVHHGIAVSFGDGRCYYITHSLLKSSDEILTWLKNLVSSPESIKVGDDLKRVLRYLLSFGVRMEGSLFDTCVASYLLDPERRDHSLGYLIEGEYGLSLPELKSQTKAAKKEDAGLFGEETVPPACSRAEGVLKVQESLEGRLREDGLLDLYNRVEAPLIAVLADMEEAGVRIDVDFFLRMSENLSTALNKIEKKIYDLAGEQFNIRSNKQLAGILFDKLGLPYGRKTKTGYSTSQDLLENLSSEHELPRWVLDYRELFKLKSTYVDALPHLVSDKTGKIHTSFNQTVVATGRLSSSQPNLQNIPMRTELGREVRKGFIADKGYALLSLDYSQVELRILAHLTGEEKLKDAYVRGEDIHRATAALIFGVEPEAVTGEMRNAAKMVNYGLLYGMSAYGLSRRLGISREEAMEFVQGYSASLPKVKKWKDSNLDSVREEGYTTTLMGRRRYIRDIRATDRSRREFAERAAINSPIQGSAADMIKLAMVNIHKELAGMNSRAKMTIQIHDELLLQVPEEEIEKICSMAKEKMVTALELDVPIEVDAGWGPTWYDAHH